MFVRQHFPFLIAVCVLLFGGFVAAKALTPGGGRLAAPEAHAMATRGEIRILDVRAEREWRETGLPEGAVGASIHHPQGRDGFVAAALAAVGGDRDRAIATIATTGVRSTRAQAWLIEAGFTRVYNVKEGMFGRYDETGAEPGWLNRGLPVQHYSK